MTRASDTAKLLGAGATILDGTTISTADNTTQLSLTSTDADANEGPVLDLVRDSASPADVDLLGTLRFRGDNDAGEVINYAKILARAEDVTDGTEDGRISINTIVAGTERSRLKIDNTEVVLNENSIDVDFRVESNTRANAFFVDGATGNIGIGVTPEVHVSSAHAIDLGNYGGILEQDEMNITSNVYLNTGSSLRYKVTDEAAMYKQTASGRHVFSTAPSGSADAAITFTNVLAIENSGQTSISDVADTANNQALSITSKCTARAGLQVTATNASFGNASYGLLRLETVRANSNAFNYAVFRANDGADIGYKFRGDGNAFADNNWNAGGADYAEYFEWKDGNSSSEDRRGYTVVLDGNQIRKSTSDDAQSSILGVVSATPAMVGDTGQMNWQGKYERDEWGSYILEEYTQTGWSVYDEERNEKLHSYQTDKIPSDVTVPSNALVTSTEADGSTKLMRRKESSSYDASKTYVPREDRVEWDTIGLVGKLRVKVGQTVGDRWIKMREISDTVHEYLVR